MSLRTKFIIVLLMFCVAVGVNIHAAAWCSRFLLADVTTGFQQTYDATFLCQLLNDNFREQGQLLHAVIEGDASVDHRERLLELLQIMIVDVRRLKGLSAGLPSASAADRLTQRAQQHYREIRDLLSEVDSGGGVPAEAINAYRTSHVRLLDELQLVSSPLISVQRQAAGKIDSTQDMINLILAAMAIIELLILLIVLSKFREWMLKPIGEIREATEQIASGNLNYRLTQHDNDELGALAGQVNHMAGSLSRAQKELKRRERMAAVGEMVSVVAHNIRNPLAGIRATAQASKNDALPDTQFHQQQDRIIKAVDSLEQWLKELLHLNRPLELKRQATDVDVLVCDLKQIFQPAIQRKNVEIVYDPARKSQVIEIDRQYFVQALSSILDNAIEAAPPGSKVKIEASAGSNADGSFNIDIIDTGHGVPESLRRQVFEPYFSTKPGGTGIGLSMAKKIVEAHDGRVTLIENPEAKGNTSTTFRISVPHAASRTR